MNAPLNLTRRQFLQNTGKAATTLAALSAVAPSVLAAKSPNETIGVGCMASAPGRRPDQCRGSRARGESGRRVRRLRSPRQKGIERSQNPEVKTYVDYRELLADKNVDAVIIGAPDHWHCQMVLDAAKPGKTSIARKASPARYRRQTHARRDQEEQGRLPAWASCAAKHRRLAGEGIDRAGHSRPHHPGRTGRFMSSDPAHPMWRWYGYYSQWNRPDPAQVVKEVNWDLWLGPAPKIAWNERHFWHWRCYWAYGTGQAGDLLSHELDFVNTSWVTASRTTATARA